MCFFIYVRLQKPFQNLNLQRNKFCHLAWYFSTFHFYHFIAHHVCSGHIISLYMLCYAIKYWVSVTHLCNIAPRLCKCSILLVMFWTFLTERSIKMFMKKIILLRRLCSSVVATLESHLYFHFTFLWLVINYKQKNSSNASQLLYFRAFIQSVILIRAEADLLSLFMLSS